MGGGGEEWWREGKGWGRGLTQTLKLRFLYVTDSTLKPIVGMVVTTSPIYVSSTPSLPRLYFDLCLVAARLACGGVAYLESIEERCFAGVILSAIIEISVLVSRRLGIVEGTYQSEYQDPDLFLRPY